MSLNAHDYDERKNISLKDLSENGKEKLANLSDKELQQLKQQAVEVEDYDIAKMIKQEQVERKERVPETEELTEKKRDDDTEYKAIQEEKNASHEENLKKANDLISQLNDGDKSQETEDSQELDWQAKREEAWKEVGKKEGTNSSEIKEENESKLNEISDKELLGTAQVIHEITEWRYRGDSRMLQRIGKYPTEKDVPGMRKYMKEHPEHGIIDKSSYYTRILEDITDLIKASNKEYNSRGILIGNPKTLEGIMAGMRFIGDNLKEAGMENSPQFEKVKSIYQYFGREKNIMEKYLNLPGHSRRRR